MTVLGIEVDSVAEEIQLPDMKFTELLATLATWSIRTERTKRELLSLIGSLSFAAKVVQPGRTFICCLLDLSCTVHRLCTSLSLSDEAKLDIQWW